jgi:nucleoside-diphosphate-sugar epimerase
LRYSGLACRHGDPANPEQAELLYGDCDLVADFSWAGVIPNYRYSKRIHNLLIQNVARYAKPSAKYIYFSTQSIYGDAHVNQKIVFRDIYGFEKFRSEKTVRRYAAKHGKKSYLFRLGHVCGELQGITQIIRKKIASGPVAIPDLNRASNTVYVATIVDAILNVLNCQAQPDTYDLMNMPQWTWKEILEFEGRRIGLEPNYEKYIENKNLNLAHFTRQIITQALLGLVRSRMLRKLSSRLLPILPTQCNLWIKAIYSQKSAALDISKLHHKQEPMDAFFFKPVGNKFLNTLTPTKILLADPKFILPTENIRNNWPEDIPLHRPQQYIDSATNLQHNS